MKLKFLLLTILTSFSLSAIAQLCSMDLDSPGFIQLKATKTYYIRTGDAEFDNAIIEAMKTSWTITPFDVMEASKLDENISNKSFSFLIPELNGLVLINGFRKHLYNYTIMDFLAYSPKHSFGDEQDITDCTFRVRNMIEAMIQVMDIVMKKSTTGGVSKEFHETYNGRSPQIKKRTLLFSEDAFKTIVDAKNPKNPKNSMDVKKLREKYQEILSKNYPFRYEICSKEKVAQAIRDKSTEYYYYQPVFNVNKKIFVFDPSNGEVVFFDSQLQGIKVTEKDIKVLVETINGKLK